MTRTLGFGLDLQPIVLRLADVIVVSNRKGEEEGRGTPLLVEVRSTGSAAKGISLDLAASGGRAHVEVEAIDKNVGAAGSSVSGGQDNVTGHLALDVDIELLNPALLVVQVLRLDRSRINRRTQGRGDWTES